MNINNYVYKLILIADQNQKNFVYCIKFFSKNILKDTIKALKILYNIFNYYKINNI